MRPIRLHPRVYDDIDEALANTREQFGPRRVLLYARLISKGRQTLRRHPTIVSCVKISVLEYVCIASRRVESMRHMATSIECTRTAPSTSLILRCAGAILDFPDRENAEEFGCWVPFDIGVVVGWR